jgi:chorismate mutase
MIIINYIIIIIIKFGDFLSNEYEVKSFKNKEEAENLLKESRNRIDEIDNKLFDLICQRTAIAKDIALAKDYLGMPIYDKSREDAIYAKIEKLSEENDIDVEIIDQIVNMLTILSKNEQKEILRRNVDG